MDQHLIRLLLHGVVQVMRQVAGSLELIEEKVQLLLLRRRESILQNQTVELPLELVVLLHTDPVQLLPHQEHVALGLIGRRLRFVKGVHGHYLFGYVHHLGRLSSRNQLIIGGMIID